MDLFNCISSYIIYFTGGLCLLMGAAQLCVRNPQKVNYISAVNLFLHSILITGSGLAADGLHMQYPWSSFLLSTSVYAIGPMNFYYYEVILYPAKPVLPRHLLHLVLPSAALLFEIIFQIEPSEMKRVIISGIYHTEIFNHYKGGLILGFLIVILYISYLIREIVPFINKKGVSSETRVVLVLNLLAVVCILFVAYGFLSGFFIMIKTGGLILSVIFIILFISQNRYPEFFLLLKREMRERRYLNSMLGGVNTDNLFYQIKALMEDECLYRDDEITLGSLADRLAITPHQLSEFLNERLDVNFSGFINSYRIEEAKKLLVQDPASSIISICFYTGFNSKSAFNLAFKKYTGYSPREYREKYLQ